jgi:hypothetical protein
MNTKQIIRGIVGGLAGGMVFGMMMGMMGMLPMIGKMVGQPSAVVGFMVHMFNSAVIGAMFSIAFGRVSTSVKSGVGFGTVYGVIWWLLGPLTLMPLMMGMGFGANWNIAAISSTMPSLVGHMVYGAILGTAHGWLSSRSAACACHTTLQASR